MPESKEKTSLEWVANFREEEGRYPTAIEYAEAGFAKETDEGVHQCTCSVLGACALQGDEHPQSTNRNCYANQLRDIMLVQAERLAAPAGIEDPEQAVIAELLKLEGTK